VPDVVVIQWPEQEGEVERLAELRIPRLLFVAPAADPPDGGDALQDWVRLPSEDRDIRARLNTLRRRAADLEPAPAVDRHGRLVFRRSWVQLSPIEERLAVLLVEAREAVVPEERLLHAGWPGGRPSSNALRVHLHRLRRRVEPLGLEIRSVRSDGWILQTATDEIGAASGG
jgi:two-component system OmpR family response regulator